MKCTNCGREIRERNPTMTDDVFGKVYLCDCCDGDIAKTMGELEDKREKIRLNYRQVECCLNCKHANGSVMYHECEILDDVDFSTVCDEFGWREDDE